MNGGNNIENTIYDRYFIEWSLKKGTVLKTELGHALT